MAPFDLTTRWPTQIAGVQMSDYVDWMRSCWYITLMTNPALSVPGGFTQAGLPIGLQMGAEVGVFALVALMAGALGDAVARVDERSQVADRDREPRPPGGRSMSVQHPAHRGTILLEDAKVLGHEAWPGRQHVLTLHAPRIAARATPRRLGAGSRDGSLTGMVV